MLSRQELQLEERVGALGDPCFLPPQRDFCGGMSGQLAHNEGGSSVAAVWRHDGIVGLETEAGQDRTEALLHMTGWISRGGCLAASLPYSHRLHGSGTPQRGLCNFRQCVCVPRSDSFARAASQEGWCLSGGEYLCWHNVWYTFLCSEKVLLIASQHWHRIRRIKGESGGVWAVLDSVDSGYMLGDHWFTFAQSLLV